MNDATEHAADRTPTRRGAVPDAALVLLSPVLFPVAVFVWILPLVILGWAAGVILLWVSGAWTAGQKLIGMFLSGVSLYALVTVHVESSDPLGAGAAIAILLAVALIEMIPGIAAIIYLARTRRPRPAPRMRV
jgi:hypothetical protein